MHIQKSFFFSCTIFFLLPSLASAATISLQATPRIVGVGDRVRVDILVDSAIPINTFSGAVSYPKTILEPIAVSDGNSIVNMWITHPAVVAGGMSIPFAGITPGGFSGNTGLLFSLLFKVKATGTGTADVSIENIEVLRNDGLGTKEQMTIKLLSLSVATKSLGGYTEPADYTQPESFNAYLGSDTQLFGGRSYLVFMAVDKGSGVDHYTVAESRFPSFLLRFFPLSWHVTASPYVPADQNLTNTIYLKAVDRAGNERLSVFPPQHLFSSYEKIVLLGILIGVVVLCYRRWGRRFRKNYDTAF